MSSATAYNFKMLPDQASPTSAHISGYVGEWHSHPPRATPLPSRTDLRQIDWLAALFDMDSQPALMLIEAIMWHPSYSGT